jgi:class 3 adenylate cyclase
VRCADAIRKAARKLGIAVRSGVHTGELERAAGDLTGLAVHIGARVGAMATADEVLVSRTVFDLAAGSGLAFVERGECTLKGVPGSWHLYALAGDERPAMLPMESSLETPLDHLAQRTARTAPRAMRAALRLGNALQRYRACARTGRV